MLTILFAVAIAGMAEREKRRAWLWGLLTALLSASIQTFLIAGYWGAVLGLIAAFSLMTYANFKYPVNKGPTLS
ncbi:MAG: hypothetical protein RLZZ227_1017 [Pseudomonadota bacterium]|jgi:predicted tellurium resistance membrane protein TerC